MSRIFISYSRKDRDFMERLQDSLTKSGFHTWVDFKDISGGVGWSDEVQQGLNQSEVMLVIVSPDSMDSTNVQDEWEYFLDKKKSLIPIVWKAADIHYRIYRLHYIDFDKQDFDSAFNQLCVVLDDKGIKPIKSSPLSSAASKINPSKSGNLWWLCHDIMELYRWLLQMNISKEWIDVGLRQSLHHANELRLDQDILVRLRGLVAESASISDIEMNDATKRQYFAGQVRDMFNLIAQRVQAADPDFDSGPG